MATRTPDHPADAIFADRWSPRAFDGSDMPEADMLTIFEAGRWAPSAYNYQPWRFLYARRGTPDFDRFLSLLVPFNQTWAKNASVLVFFVSERTMGSPDKPSASHSFDTGAAWMSMALQATKLGYHSHGMSGIEFDKARAELQLPDDWQLDAAAVFGTMGNPEDLPDGLREREVPSDRRDLAQTAIAGNFAG